MEAVKARWTDDRLDDLKLQVEALGRRMDEGFQEQREENRAMQQSIVDLHKTMSDLHKTVSQFAMMLVGALIGLFAAQIGLILTQL
jgi:hypothetical protein